MNAKSVLLVEKDEIRAEMLMKVLDDNNIPNASMPVSGSGFVMKSGVKEW